MYLKGKHIILGISGGIAAYKCCHLTRLLVKAGARVQVILSPSAVDFVSPLTLSVLSGEPVLSEFYDNQKNWNNHVKAGISCDLFMLAPATANTLAKMVQGLCDNLLMAVLMSTRSDIMVAPAMDLDMYAHSSTRNNLDELRNRGVIIIPPGTGELASGLTGEGRMAEPEEIFDEINNYFCDASALKGKKILVTAGPTVEPIDPVRYISNHSSGKTGIAISKALCRRGAEVVLISGPVHHALPVLNGLTIVKVKTAIEMHDACIRHWPDASAAILSAAVADYRSEQTSAVKIKKTSSDLTLKLVRNPDIAQLLGEQKKKGQFILGFALETGNLLENAMDKLKRKNLDVIFANSLQEEKTGFGFDTNRLDTIFADGSIIQGTLKTKEQIAADIAQVLISLMHGHLKQ